MKNILEKILLKYDVFILDQWGVIHDGKNKYYGIDKFLNILNEHKKKIILLSNSSQNKINMINETLIPLGFNKNLFKDIISSGEILNLVKKGKIKNKLFEILNYKDCYVISNKNDLKNIDLLGIKNMSIDKAKFILAMSITPNKSSNEIKKIVNKINKYNIPIICTNPDKYVIDALTKNKTYQVGFLINKLNNKKYINFIGKPYDLIYKYMISKNKLDVRKCLVFGDSLETDIQGAKRNKIDSVLVKNGIHNKQFKNLKKNKKFQKDISKNKPTYIIDDINTLIKYL